MARKKKFTPKAAIVESDSDSGDDSSGDNEDEVNSYHTIKEKELFSKSSLSKNFDSSDDEDGQSEEGVLSLDDEDSDSDDYDNSRFAVELKKDEMASDLEDSEDDLPEPTAWGNKKTDFYNTDFVDKDFRNQRLKDQDLAQYEEEEALAIQKRLLNSITESDVGIDFLIGDIEPEVSKEANVKYLDGDEERLQTNVSNLTKRQKLDIIRKESPELEGLLSDFSKYMSELKDRLLPVMQAIKEKNANELGAVKYIETRFHIIYNYCLNICFYLALKMKRIAVKDHPVIKQILSFKKLLLEMNAIGDTNSIEKNIDSVLHLIRSGQPFNFAGLSNKRKVEDKPTTGKRVKFADDLIHGEPLSQAVVALDDNQEMDKRAITYEMEKNKGLTPKRKKELKNPRVKHRMKYRKAKIRRKGQVREPRKELQRYGGELSGIKSGVVKSVKFK